MDCVSVIKEEPRAKLKKIVPRIMLHEKVKIIQLEPSLAKTGINHHELIDLGYEEANQNITYLKEFYKVSLALPS